MRKDANLCEYKGVCIIESISPYFSPPVYVPCPGNVPLMAQSALWTSVVMENSRWPTHPPSRLDTSPWRQRTRIIRLDLSAESILWRRGQVRGGTSKTRVVMRLTEMQLPQRWEGKQPEIREENDLQTMFTNTMETIIKLSWSS